MYKAIIRFKDSRDYKRKIMLILTEKKGVKIIRTSGEDSSLYPRITLMVDSPEVLNSVVNEMNKEIENGVTILSCKLSIIHFILEMICPN